MTLSAMMLAVVAAQQSVAQAIFADDFDDNTTDTTRWSAFTQGSGPTIAETNQRLEISFPATSSDPSVFSGRYESSCTASGDFDAQVDFHLLEWPAENGVRVGLSTDIAGPAGYSTERVSFGSGQQDFPGNKQREVYVSDFSGSVQGFVATSDLAGKLRQTRVGSTIRSYHYDAAAGTWIETASANSVLGASTFVLGAWSHDYAFSDQTVRVAFDNFVVEGALDCPNTAPVAAGDAYTTDEDVFLNVPAVGLLVNDSDPEGDPLSASLVNGPGPNNGTVVVNPDGSFTYTPNANFNGTDTFTYAASDGAESAPATVTITVTPVNDAPVAVDGAYTAYLDTPLAVAVPGVLARATDVDGDALSALLVSGPSHGTLTLNEDGSFTYTPAEDYLGGDSFTYHASDASLESEEATVNITVRAACNGLAASIVGTPGADRLKGTPGADVIVGLGGADAITAADGDDHICGGSGPDTISASSDNDTLLGGSGSDVLIGGSGNDTLSGGAGIDALSGDSGRDHLDGGDARDTCLGGTGTDTATACEQVNAVP